ncbi:MAG: hypothetical protein PQJ58_19275 [Spirochaetales bacterium]|nr:hypothetical protein [Spirochaetales bacterium]
MPQLSLYIDKETMKDLESAAKMENLSISKYTVKLIRESIHSKWPSSYGDLYGKIEDESFAADKADDFRKDIPRESL